MRRPLDLRFPPNTPLPYATATAKTMTNNVLMKIVAGPESDSMTVLPPCPVRVPVEDYAAVYCPTQGDSCSVTRAGNARVRHAAAWRALYARVTPGPFRSYLTQQGVPQRHKSCKKKGRKQPASDRIC